MHAITQTLPNVSITLNNSVLSPILCEDRPTGGYVLLIPVGQFRCVWMGLCADVSSQ